VALALGWSAASGGARIQEEARGEFNKDVEAKVSAKLAVVP
jgi:hypothetical protein